MTTGKFPLLRVCLQAHILRWSPVLAISSHLGPWSMNQPRSCSYPLDLNTTVYTSYDPLELTGFQMVYPEAPKAYKPEMIRLSLHPHLVDVVLVSCQLCMSSNATWKGRTHEERQSFFLDPGRREPSVARSLT